MNRFFCLCVIAVLSSVTFAANPTAVLPDLWNPGHIILDDLNLYVSQRESVYIFRLKDFKLIAQIGGAGEGPQQFIPRPGGAGILIFPQTDRISLAAYGKIAYYSKEGKFISEKRTPNDWRLIPFKDKFLSIEEYFDSKKNLSEYVLVLYDSRFKKEKEITRRKGFKNYKKTFPADIPIFSVWKDKVAVKGEGEAFAVDIYDYNGKFLEQAFIPVGKWMAQRFYPSAVHNERFYQLIENEDTEEWELHVSDIK